MRNGCSILLVVLLCAGCATVDSGSGKKASASKNLLKDASFEIGEAGAMSPHWMAFGQAHRERRSSRSGAHAIKLYGNFDGQSNYSGVFQDVAVEPGKRYKAGIYVQSDADDFIVGSNSAWIQVEFYNEAKELLQRFPSERRFTRQYAANKSYHLETDVLEAPESSSHARVVYIFEQGIHEVADGGVTSDPGSTFGDDASFVEVK